MKTDYICKTCRIHTQQNVNQLGNGNYTITCNECHTVSPIFDKNDKEVPVDKIIEAKKNWA